MSSFLPDSFSWYSYSNPKLVSIGQDWQAFRNRRERTLLEGRANIILGKLKFNPLIVNVKGTWKVLWEANEYGSTADYVRQWLDLLEMGLLPQLKRCGYRNCRKWYFAKFSHTSFHSVKCRNTEKEADPIRREKRQDYERRYYRDVLSKYGKRRKKL